MQKAALFGEENLLALGQKTTAIRPASAELLKIKIIIIMTLLQNP